MSGLQQAWRCGYRGRPGWRIKFAYNEMTVERLKAEVPHTARIWEDEKKEWWINGAYESTLLTLFPDFRAFLDQKRLFE